MKVFILTLEDGFSMTNIIGVYSSKVDAEKQGEYELLKHRALVGGLAMDVEFEVREYEVK
jgi:hypothetical protein